MKTETSLVVDLGNTFAKTGLFDAGGRLLEVRRKLTVEDLTDYLTRLAPDRTVISSTALSGGELTARFGSLTGFLLVMSPETPVPVQKLYDTPQTLGADRVAAAVGARGLFPGRNCLVIDMGTCITYDYVDNLDRFHGGLISPGLRMRFRAMHSFTQRLPLADPPETLPPLVGKSTVHAMQSGVLYGLIAEVGGIIDQYRSIYPDFQVVLCGGDAPFFESRLKEPIFAAPELVLLGLHRILNHNV